jgi:hypothetical protein
MQVVAAYHTCACNSIAGCKGQDRPVASTTAEARQTGRLNELLSHAAKPGILTERGKVRREVNIPSTQS